MLKQEHGTCTFTHETYMYSRLKLYKSSEIKKKSKACYNTHTVVCRTASGCHSDVECNILTVCPFQSALTDFKALFKNQFLALFPQRNMPIF